MPERVAEAPSLDAGQGLPRQPLVLWLRRWDSDAGSLAAALDGLSAQEHRWAEALPQGLRRRYLLSRARMRHLLAPLLGLPAGEVPLWSPPRRPPALLRGCGWLSLAHSRDQLLLGYSTRPLGVDLEAADRPIAGARLARRLLPAAEWQALQAQPQERTRAVVLERWVRLEACLKWRRGTLAGDLGAWHPCGGAGRFRHRSTGALVWTEAQLRRDWLCAVAAGEAPAVTWR
jgi:phosphopantetheinyl transferase